MRSPLLRNISLCVMISSSLFSQMAIAKASKKDRRIAQNLQNELSDLGKGGFAEAPAEQMYVVQDRHVDLSDSWQMMLGVGTNLNSNIYLNTNETSLGVRYHFGNMFFAQIDGSKVNSELTESGQRIWKNDGIYPDTSFVKSRYGGALGLNLMYGKVRVTKDFVFYFDQFFSIGGGSIEQSNGVETTKTPVITAEAGLSFSVGRYLSLILGVRDNFFEERRRSSSEKIHQVVAYSGVGVLLGGKAL